MIVDEDENEMRGKGTPEKRSRVCG